MDIFRLVIDLEETITFEKLLDLKVQENLTAMTMTAT